MLVKCRPRVELPGIPWLKNISALIPGADACPGKCIPGFCCPDLIISLVVLTSALMSAEVPVMLDVVRVDVVTFFTASNDTPTIDDTNSCDVDTDVAAVSVDTTRSAGLAASGG
jgi:hypothetical protein